MRMSSEVAVETRPVVARPMNRSSPRISTATVRNSGEKPIAADIRPSATSDAARKLRNIPARANASL
jgi:hypothetical protein